jgi:hypothetical protein
MTSNCLFDASTAVRHERLRAAAERRVLNADMPARRRRRVRVSWRPQRSWWMPRAAAN